MKKIACVTGSRRGIGLAIGRELAKNGYTVVLSAVSPESEAEDVVHSFEQEGLSACYYSCDISQEENRAGLFAFIQSRYGRLDVLVNNAGVAPSQRMDLLETTRESFERVLCINLEGTFFMCQQAANVMLAMRAAALDDYTPRIVNISSVSSYTSSVNRGEYCVSKAGISMVTQLFADRLAQDGIPVFEVRPGIIATDMTAGVRQQYEEKIAQGITPIRRMGQPQDVADCVMAAVSGRLDFATGQVLNADGGFHLRRL